MALGGLLPCADGAACPVVWPGGCCVPAWPAGWLARFNAYRAAAGVPRLEHDSFHGLRRKWSTERKHLPGVDVAKAGGWRSIMTMKRAYQQADEVGVLEAVLDPRRLREQGA